MWSEPRQVVMPDGSNLSMVYVDTEGFESTGEHSATIWVNYCI